MTTALKTIQPAPQVYSPPVPPEETPPLGMAPGLGTVGGAPTDADSQAKPADSAQQKPSAKEDPRVEAVPEKKEAAQSTQKAEDPRVSAVPEQQQAKQQPATTQAAEDPRVQPVPEQQATQPPQVQPPQSQLPSQFQTPPQPQIVTDPESGTRYVVDPQSGQKIPYAEPATAADKTAQPPGTVLPPVTVQSPQPQTTTTMPSGTGEGANQPVAADPQIAIAALIASGKSPGEAKALVNGESPKTLAGKAPAPKPTTPPIDNLGQLGDEDVVKDVLAGPTAQAPAPTTPGGKLGDEDLVKEVLAGLKPPTPVDTLKADDKNRVDPVQLYSYLLGKFSHSSVLNYIPPDGDYWQIKHGTAAEWAAFGLAVAKQESDLNTKSYNDRDPGGSAGLFQFGQGQKPFVQGNQFDPQQSADAFVRAVEHYLGHKGSIANMGVTFGSIARRNEAGQYIAGAQKVAAGGDGKELVSSGGGGGKGRHRGGGGGGGGDTVQPNIPLGSSASAPQQQPWSSVGGSSSGGTTQSPPGDSGAGSLGLGLLGGALAAGALQGKGGQQQQPQPQQPPPPDETQQQNPLISALMQRGFTPQQAAQLAQGMQTITPGKGVPALKTGGPPPAPSAPAQLPAPSIQLTQVPFKPVSPKQLMPGKIPAIVPAKKPAPPAPGKTIPTGPAIQLPSQGKQPPAPPAPSGKTPIVTVNTPQTQQQAPPPPKDQPRHQATEPTAFTGGRPAGSTHGDNSALEGLTGNLKQMAVQHAGLLSEDDPRVKKQSDGKIKGEHFVPGDQFHARLWSKVPGGQQGRQRQIVGQAEQAIADKTPMHISYISSPKEAALHPTRESRTIQYEEHSPEHRLMGTTEGQLVGHSMIPVSVGITPPKKASDPHESVINGISTNVLANNFHHINRKLAEMGRSTPYKTLGPKFNNDLEGYLSNLNAGHTGTGYGHAVGTAEYPNSPDENHVPYKLTRREADFINAAINNTAAFAKHEDGQALRRLAEANGTLITPEGETNRMLHEIELHEPGWSGRGSGKKGRVLEPSIRSFKTGLIHDVHASEEHMPATIRPGKEYQDLTKSVARTSQQGRPDVPVSVSPRSQPMAGVRRDLAHNQKINVIEREFSEDRINETQARKLLEAIGENPAEYQFHGGSGGMLTPYEPDPTALTAEEHSEMKDNLRKQWVGGKLPIEDYRRKAAEIPLPTKPSKPAVLSKANEPGNSPSSLEPASPGSGLAMPRPRLAESESEPRRDPSTTASSPEPLTAQPKPKAPKPEPVVPAAEPETPEPLETPPAKAPAPDEPLPPVQKVKAVKPAAVKPPEPAAPTAALEKPSWKTANEKKRQAYLKQRVAQDLDRQYKGADAHQLEVDRNDDKSIKYDPAGNPIYKKHDYDIANSPLLKKKGLNQIKNADEHEDTLGNLIGPDGKEAIDPATGKPVLKHAHLNQVERSRLSAMHTASAVHTMGNKIVDEFMKIKDQPEIMAGEGWYSRMREKLASALGEHHELFAQLLGATSAKTPVRNNFIQSLDALEQYKNGKFDNHIKKYLEAYEKMQEGKGALVAHMKSQGIPLYDKDGNTVDTHDTDAAAIANWVHHHGILPRQQIQEGQEEGSKYNANSMSVLRALAGTWLKEVNAPKTPNFAGNLTGRTLEATIDVWAARFLKRLGYEGHGEGPWRAQGKSEPGVNALDFAFSQDAMRHAADEITKRTGKKMNPDDLQAIAWFAEKHHWEKQGWTRGAGAEKSSFDDVADLAFPKTGEPMTSADLRKHYAAIQAEQKRVKARVKTAKTYVGHANPKMAAKLEPYMAQHGLTHEQVHGPEVEEEDEGEAA